MSEYLITISIHCDGNVRACLLGSVSDSARTEDQLIRGALGA